LAVLTYKDVSHIAYSSVERVTGSGVQLLDQYCLDNVVRYVGDRVAVVVAETPAVAEQALQLISVEYDVLPAVLDQRQALEVGATRVHAELASQGIADASRNIAARLRLDVGDVEGGFASADHVIETEYIVPPIQQAPLEMHTVITYFDAEDYLVVCTNNHVPNYLRRTLATLTGLPMRRIRVEQPELGGDLGLRQHIEGEDLCALLTLTTKRPVKLEYSRADEFRSNHARQQYILRVKTGVQRDGEIVASQMVVLADTGAYGTHALTTSTPSVHALALYPCANMRFLAEVLYTNHSPAAPTQGYNLQHEFFALESHMDEVAKQLRMDALALRRRNWLNVGDRYPFLAPVEKTRGSTVSIASSGLATCTRLVEEKLAWSKKRGVKSSDRYRHGVGMALAFYGDPGVMAGTSGATIKLNEDGSFDIFAGRSENGSQLTTFLTQIAAEVLGVAVVDILLHAPDTSSSPVENSANDVAAFYMNGNAVKKAAEQIQRQILSVAGRMLNVVPETLKISNGMLKGPLGQQLTVAQVSSHSMYVENRQLMTTAFWKGQHMPITFAAQGVEIEVDIETGSIRVLKVVTAVDAGTPMNPTLFEGQIEGDVAQALGMSLSEELLYDQNGAVLTTSWLDSHMLSALEMPELQTYLVDSKDPSELFGAKALSGIALYGIAPAIANAILDAVDIRIRYLPFTPERILRAVHAYMAKYSS
jgi:putative selenate reductase molybdopterin-binding subunit